MSLAYGYARIKRERKTFHTRIEDIYDEFKFTYSKGLLAGLVLSIVSFGLGLYLPMGMLVLIAAVSVAAALTFRQSLLSAAYTLGVSIVAGLCIEYTGFGALDELLPQLSLANWPAAAVLLGLLLVAEGVLVYKTAHIKTSPAIVMSKGGSRSASRLRAEPGFCRCSFSFRDMRSNHRFRGGPFCHLTEALSSSGFLISSASAKEFKDRFRLKALKLQRSASACLVLSFCCSRPEAYGGRRLPLLPPERRSQEGPFYHGNSG